jgi:hypothetical protein
MLKTILKKFFYVDKIYGDVQVSTGIMMIYKRAVFSFPGVHVKELGYLNINAKNNNLAFAA